MKLTGNLFDTKTFNRSIDLCEAHNVQFRMVACHLGQSGATSSEVVLQGLSENERDISEVEAEITKVCMEADVNLVHV